MIMWLRKIALERGADPGQRGARPLVEGVGLELDPVGAERLERMGELEELGLAVGAGPLERGADPGPADLEPPMLGHDRQEPGAADRPAGGALDRGERALRARPRRWPAPAVEPAPQPGLVLRAE